MAVPLITDRVAPTSTSFFLKNGFRALITFELDNNILLWEKTVTPPGFDGQAPVDLSNMWWVKWAPQVPHGLAKMTEAQMIVAYDPAVLARILAAINREDTITITFPNTTQWAFYGYLRVFRPNEMRDGEQPTALAIIEPTIWDGSAANWPDAESIAAYTA